MAPLFYMSVMLFNLFKMSLKNYFGISGGECQKENKEEKIHQLWNSESLANKLKV